MGCGTSFVKYVLFFFNLLFALVGLCMVGIGAAVLLKWTVITDLLKGHLTVAPWIFIVVGAIVFIIAFFGCCGAIRESHCMVVTYAIFLLVAIIIQVILAVLVFVYVDNINKGIADSVHHLFQESKTDQVIRESFNNIEIQLTCCGDTGPSNYDIVSLPESCCSDGYKIIGTVVGRCTHADAGYRKGCSVVATELFQKWSIVIAGVAIGVACIEVIGALFALCLANSIRNMDRRYA